MALSGKAILGVWNDIDPAIEEDYNAWYQDEHIPERLSVPGIMRGRRYRAAQGSPRFMAFYEAATLEVLTTGAYRTQLANPTTWTRRVMSGFRLMQRGICAVVASAGDGIGGAATVIHIRPQAGGEALLQAWADRTLPLLLVLPQVIAAHVWAVAPGEPASPTIALTQGSASERPVHWVLMIEAADEVAVGAARAAALDSDPATHGAAEVMAYPTYQLLFALTAQSQGAVAPEVSRR